MTYAIAFFYEINAYCFVRTTFQVFYMKPSSQLYHLHYRLHLLYDQ